MSNDMSVLYIFFVTDIMSPEIKQVPERSQQVSERCQRVEGKDVASAAKRFFSTFYFSSSSS